MLLTLLLAFSVEAAVPYDEIERLRQMSVVTRVVLDNPASSLVKKCKIKDPVLLGSKLQLATANAEARWAEVKVEEADLPKLKEKLGICAARGSCQVYSDFLGSAQVEDESMRLGVAETLAKLESETFVKALKSVPNACGRVRELQATD